jgi:ribosomal protein S18 acetylase RimI-like enzyme
MKYRKATQTDSTLLGELNHQLIQDEGHRNPMTLSEIQARMSEWLSADYTGILFDLDEEPVAYALYREKEDSIYLRQFFVQRHRRKQGIGSEAMQILISEIWPKSKRITLEVLVHNSAAIEFYRKYGFQDYCLGMERTK